MDRGPAFVSNEGTGGITNSNTATINGVTKNSATLVPWGSIGWLIFTDVSLSADTDHTDRACHR